MTTGAIIWLVLFSVAAAAFFGVAVFAGINGFRDLKTLLAGTKRKSNGGEE